MPAGLSNRTQSRHLSRDLLHANLCLLFGHFSCSKAQKKKQKKNMARFLKEAEGGKKPMFDQAKMSFDEYLNQYYNLDFEDLV